MNDSSTRDLLALFAERWPLDVDRIDRRHRNMTGEGRCEKCRAVWPCEPRRLVDAIKLMRGRVLALESFVDPMKGTDKRWVNYRDVVDILGIEVIGSGTE